VPRIVAAEHGIQVAGVLADVLESPEHMDRNRDDITWPKDDFAVFLVWTQQECPLTRVHDEDFGRFMAVLGVDAARRLPRASNVESVRDIDVDMLVRALCNAWSDNRKVFFLRAARGPGIDKRGRAGPQLGIANEH
jgi:hypothetical protein